MARRVLTVLLVLCALVGGARAEEKTLFERWYVMEMMEQRAGWMHTVTVQDGDQIRSDAEMRIFIERAGSQITISVAARFVETADGEPVSADSKMSFGGPATVTTYEFLKDGVRQTTQAGEQKNSTMLPAIEGPWLTPWETRNYMTERLAAGPETITLRTIDPTTGIEPVTITYRDMESTTIELMGRTVKAFKCTSINSSTPNLPTTEFLDEHGQALRTEMDMGGMTIVVIAADRELATSNLKAPEMMASLFISPSRPIPGARTLEKATYLLHVPSGELALPPVTGSQRVERVDDQSVRVMVHADHFEPAGETDRDAYLAASTMLDTNDPQIIELRNEALDGVGEGKAERAEAMRRFVYRHIRKKSLGVGFASASEVARSCEGDCSEHGTLLAALLRADGIPSRVVSGVVYVDEFAGSKAVFGYHMWTQALLTVDGEDRWVDFDATLPGALDYDATHIALGLSSLKDGEMVNGLVTLAPLMGRLQIDVESLD